MQARERLIVALDVKEFAEAAKLINVLSPAVDIFKIGIGPFTGFGLEILQKMEAENKKLFLDLKFHDIPNTIYHAARAAAKHGALMMNFHCLGGREMLEAAVKGAEDGCAEGVHEKPFLLGVTILTSMGQDDMNKLGIAGKVSDKVLELAAMAKDAGLDGVVASAKEVRAIKEKVGKEFVVVTPGIRPEWAAAGDQKRVVTPKQAITDGADYIVVGRPIVAAEDPLEAAKRIIEEMES
jgi:orotidine-5'-phosphate decarboxylase